MKKPLIGIITKYFKDEYFYDWTTQVINNDLRYALCKNGANIIGILPQTPAHFFQEEDEHDETIMTDEEKSEISNFVDMCDGIVLQGGVYSSYCEEFVAKYCYEKDKPILGICAGYNCMIRALGGTTKALIDNSRHNRPDLKYVHKCNVIDKNSLFYNIVKRESFDVNSIHSYIADKLPKELKTVAMSDDGQIEVVEAEGKRFCLGVKFHPEFLCDDDKWQNDIFVEFLKVCKNENKN